MPRWLIVLSAVCFGTTGTAQALGAAGAAPVTVGAVRLLIGALGLQLVARITTGRFPPLPRTPRLWLGALAVAGYQIGFFLAVRWTGVAIGTVVALGSAPVVTGALGWALRQGRPGPRWMAATALACAGLAVLTLGGGSGRVGAGGVLLALLAACCYAGYTVLAKQEIEAGAGPEATMATLFSAGALLLAPAVLVLPVGWLATGPGLLAALWLGLVPTALAYLLFARGLRRVPAAEAATLTLAEPLTAALLGVLLLGESPGPGAATGGGLLLLGLLVLGLRPPGRRRAPATVGV